MTTKPRHRPPSWAAWAKIAERRCPDAAPLAQLIAARRQDALYAQQIDDEQRAQLHLLTRHRLTTVARNGAILRLRKQWHDAPQYPA